MNAGQHQIISWLKMLWFFCEFFFCNSFAQFWSVSFVNDNIVSKRHKTGQRASYNKWKALLSSWTVMGRVTMASSSFSTVRSWALGPAIKWKRNCKKKHHFLEFLNPRWKLTNTLWVNLLFWAGKPRPLLKSINYGSPYSLKNNSDRHYQYRKDFPCYFTEASFA